MVKRCFISIELPEEVKKEIQIIQNKLPEFNGKKIGVENLHLTLKFLGGISDDKIEMVKEKLSRVNFGLLDCEIDSLGVFSENFVRIIWLHLNGCEEIQKKIDESLDGIFEKEKRFMGHITIARVKSVKDKKEFLDDIKKIKFEKMKFNIDRCYLMESTLKPEGSEYAVIGEYHAEKI